MTRKVPSHSCLTEHEASRSYQPSSTGIAAYYQAEQSGGLAVCPPLPRVPSTHHLHGEGPAEEVSNNNLICLEQSSQLIRSLKLGIIYNEHSNGIISNN